MTNDASAGASAPCTGIRVLDFTTVVSGPICSQALGDLGADVIKLETLAGDMSRSTGGPFHAGLSGFFTQFNRNKRSIALDLKSQAGREVVLRLAPLCDVVVENFRPGVADRLGIGWEALRGINPRLVYAAISGFGPDGPYAGLPAYDHVVQGLAGMMPVQGQGGRPQMFRSVVADKAAGQAALAAILAALFARERGLAAGQRIDVPMLDAYAAFMLPELLGPDSFPDVDERPPGFDLFRVFETADGHVVGFAVQDEQHRALCRALEREDLAEDARFASLGARFANLDLLFEQLAEAILRWPTAELIRRAREQGAPFAPVNDFAAFRDDPQVRHNGVVAELHDADVGRVRMIRHPARLGATPVAPARRPPRLGEQSEEILRLAGYDEAEIAGLIERGVVRRSDVRA